MTSHRLFCRIVLSSLAILSAPAAQTPDGDVLALMQASYEAGARRAWPGFGLSDQPTAVFDGTRTLLAGHPSPPPGFNPLPGRPGVLLYAGRYPAVAGNSTADIAGVRTATVVATAEAAGAISPLAYVEEVFHVFWLRRHTTFRPNEMARYAYPMKDLRNSWRVLAEEEALARALESGDVSNAAAWAAAALRLRRERHALLTADDRAFETGLEMMEGTANYVARIVVGLDAAYTVARLRTPRPADQLRWRYYESGAAICLLLDRFDRGPGTEVGWKGRIDRDPGRTTIALLQAAVERAGARPAAFQPGEVSRFENAAQTSIAELSARQELVRGELQDRVGARIVIDIAGADALRITRFDPINLFVLNGIEVAHPRYITLDNSDGTVEVANAGYQRGSFAGTVALTRSAGRHPLANGIRSLTVVGLPEAPRIDQSAGRVSIEAEGIRVVFREAVVVTEGATLRVAVGRPVR